MLSDILAESADLNLVEAIREMGRWQRRDLILERAGILFVVASLPFPLGYTNAVVRLDRSLPATQVVAEAKAFFAQYNYPFTVWMRGGRDDDLIAELIVQGLKRVAVSPSMFIDKLPTETRIPVGFELRRVNDESGVRDIVRVNREAYADLGVTPEAVEESFVCSSKLLSSNIIAYVAYHDHRPVSTAIVVMAHRVAGVYWVGTSPSARRRGLGAVCTRAATIAGLENGCLIGALQASHLGKSVYERLGFVQYSRTEWYNYQSVA